MKKATIFFVCVLIAQMGSGCDTGNVSFDMGDHLVGEEYPDAEKYQVGAFTYAADDVNYVDVYWRSGEVKIVESDRPQLSVRESGGDLCQSVGQISNAGSTKGDRLIDSHDSGRDPGGYIRTKQHFDFGTLRRYTAWNGDGQGGESKQQCRWNPCGQHLRSEAPVQRFLRFCQPGQHYRGYGGDHNKQRKC